MMAVRLRHLASRCGLRFATVNTFAPSRRGSARIVERLQTGVPGGLVGGPRAY